MTTASQIVERAYRKIRVVAEDEAMNADQAVNGLAELNSMMHGWKLFGVDVTHADLDLDDDFTLADEFVEGTVYQLATRLSPTYNQPAPDADRFFRALQAAYMEIEASSLDTALTRMPSDIPRRRGFT